MALIKCSECGKEVSSKANACPHCGNPIIEEIETIKEKGICPNCGHKNKEETVFCIKCGSKITEMKTEDNLTCHNCGNKNKEGTVFCSKCGKNLNSKKVYCEKCGYQNTEEDIFCEQCGNKLKNKKSGWNFDSIFLAITFLLTGIFGTFLFSSYGFRKRAPLVEDIFLFNNKFLGIVTLIIGISILIYVLVKDGFSLQNDLDHLKKFKLSKFHVSIVFILSSICLLFSIGPSEHKEIGKFILPSFIFLMSFLSLIATLIALNWSKLGWIYEGFVLLLSIGFFVASIYLFSYGNEQNNSFESQARSLYEHGRTNPGDEYFTYGAITLVLAIIFLVLFIIMLVKGRKNEK